MCSLNSNKITNCVEFFNFLPANYVLIVGSFFIVQQLQEHFLLFVILQRVFATFFDVFLVGINRILSRIGFAWFRVYAPKRIKTFVLDTRRM